MAYRRTSYLLSPGEELLITYDVVKHLRHFEDFVVSSGLEPERLVNNPLCAIPIPVYDRDENGRLKRLSGANVAFMTHPLMWLPEGTATPRQIAGADGRLRMEFESEWAIRVATELTFSGLYDPAEGTWLDVLALHDLDVSNPVDFARVEEWLDGASDPILDHIDLTDFVTVDGDPDWAVHSVQKLHPVLIAAQWSFLSESLERILDRECAETTGDEQRRIATIIVELAIDLLSDVPAAPETAVTISDLLLTVLDKLEDADVDVDGTVLLGRTLLLDEKERYEFAAELVRPA